MFYYLFYPLRQYFFAFNVFRYITFRSAGAAITAMLIGLCLGPYIIKWLTSLKLGERIRSGKDYQSFYDLHKKKQGTPTMGGIIILIAVICSTLLWADILNRQIWIVLLATVWLGSLGFIDDYLKLKEKRWGLTARLKLFFQIGLAVILFILLYLCPETRDIVNKLTLPLYKTPLSLWAGFYLIFIILVICGSSNAVNLTDGLDGLAIGCILIVTAAYAVLSYIVGHREFAGYLNVLYVPGSSELTVFCASILGAGLSFLWFNSHPAEVFMGDTGALTVGGVIGVVSILIKKELWLIIIGGIFVVEACSVILQVLSFRLTGKRIFAMAPLHHHFEMRGIPESKITIRFWIVAIIFALIGLGSLKLQ